MGMIAIVQPVNLLRVMWVRARLTKRDLGGALGAVNVLMVQLSGLIFPPIASAVYRGGDGYNIGTVSTMVLVCQQAVIGPSLVFLSPLMMPIAKGAFKASEEALAREAERMKQLAADDDATGRPPHAGGEEASGPS